MHMQSLNLQKRMIFTISRMIQCSIRMKHVRLRQQAVLILPEQRHIIIRGIITYWVMMGKQSADQIL